jgi:hypothetical protein
MPLGWHHLAAKHPLVERRERLPVSRHEVGVHVPGLPSHQSLHHVCRTPGISCEAVPASEVDRRGHEAALLPRNGAAESFVSFI